MQEMVHALALRLAERGVVVHQARTAEDARRIVAGLARSRGVRLVVKAKTMTGEEADLGQALEGAGCRVVETDLGEFIVQLRGEPPSHILAPALHLSRAAVGRLFAKRLGMEPSDDPAVLAAFARRHLRGEFLAADMGVIGVNLAIASTGDLVTVSNEGNARLCATLPPLLVAVTGLEKVVATPEDAAAVLRLLPRNATGQTATTYVSLLRGPALPGEPFGPREVHLVLLDNGRSRIASDPDIRDILRCIRCGACLNICPVYRTIGGHAYGTTYPGPMGILWTAGLHGTSRIGDLAYASSLCGECSRVCPVGIDIAGAIRALRARARKPLLWRAFLAAVRIVMSQARLFAWAGSALSWLARRWPGLYRGLARRMGWTTSGDLPVPAPVSFRRLWLQQESKTQDCSRPSPPLPPFGQPSPPIEDRPRSASPGDPNRGLGNDLSRFLAEFMAASGEVMFARDVALAMRQVVEAVRPSVALVSADAEEAAEALRHLGVRVLVEPETSREDAARADLGVTSCLALVAETGSILLAHPQGRTASLLPETHVVVASPKKTLASLEDALAAAAATKAQALCLITGPSRTADIEKTLILGMHGPRRLILALVTGDPTDEDVTGLDEEKVHENQGPVE